MNRRDQHRMDERRKAAHAPKHHELNSSDTSKSLMDNYFESQKVIQSLTPKTDGGTTKSFKIPKKQPPTIGVSVQDRNGNNGSAIGKNADSEQYKNRADDNLQSPINRYRGNDKNRRQDWNDRRDNQNRRFDAERRQPDQATPAKRDSFDRRGERTGVEIDVRIKRNEKEVSILDRIRRNDDLGIRREPNINETNKPSTTNNQDPRSYRDRYRDERKEPSILDRIRRDDVSDNKRFDNAIRRKDNEQESRIIEKAFPDDGADSSQRKRMRLESPPRQKSIAPVKKSIKNRIYEYSSVDIEIRDFSHPKGEMSPENVAIFLNEIEHAVSLRIFTNPTYQTKFIGHKHVNGILTMMCADDFTSVFLQQKVTEELSLWPGAKLEWAFGSRTIAIIKLIIPHSIPHISEFREIVKKTDARMDTDKWRRIDCEDSDDDTGKLYKLAIDKPSLELMKQQGNIVRCGNLEIKIEHDIPGKILRKQERRAQKYASLGDSKLNQRNIF